MKFEEFEKKYLEKILNEKPSFIRKGQALFNYLYEIKPKIADAIRTTSVDCFYNDRLIPSTLKYLKLIWNNYSN